MNACGHLGLAEKIILIFNCNSNFNSADFDLEMKELGIK